MELQSQTEWQRWFPQCGAQIADRIAARCRLRKVVDSSLPFLSRPAVDPVVRPLSSLTQIRLHP